MSEPCTCYRVRLWDMHISKDPGTSAAQSSQIKRHTCTHTLDTGVRTGQWTGVNDSASKIACDTKKLLALKEGTLILSNIERDWLNQTAIIPFQYQYHRDWKTEYVYMMVRKATRICILLSALIYCNSMVLGWCNHTSAHKNHHKLSAVLSERLWNSFMCDLRWIKTLSSFILMNLVWVHCTRNKSPQHKKVKDFTDFLKEKLHHFSMFCSKG